MSRTDPSVRALLICVGLCHLILLSWFLDQPLGARNPFRETQTALSIYWMSKGGPFWAYETPIFGYPWSVPFEMPLYQWLVAKLCIATGLPIAAIGRVLSALFFAGAILLGARALNRTFPSEAGRGVGLMFVAAASVMTLHLYWAHQVSIETLALLLGVAWLVLVVEALVARKPLLLLAAIAVGCVGAAVKAPTMFPYFLLGGFAFIQFTLREWRASQDRVAVNRVLTVTFCVAGAAPVIAAFLWTMHADGVKSLSLLGAWTSSASEHIGRWNFGTLEQRFDARFWIDNTRRAGPAFVALALLAFVHARRGDRKTLLRMAALVATYFAPIFVFANLHHAHDYYGMANHLLLAAAVAVGLSALNLSAEKWVGALAAFAVLNVVVFFYAYAGFLNAEAHPNVQRAQEIGAHLEAKTSEDEVVAVFTTHWGTEFAYGSNRRVITILPQTPPSPRTDELQWRDALALLKSDPGSMIGERKIGAVLYCGQFYFSHAQVREIRAAFPGLNKAEDFKRHQCAALTR